MNMKNDIFKYLNPYNNDKISDMKGHDLTLLFILLNDYYMEKRNKLGFDKDVSFGLELEIENTSRDLIETEILCNFIDRKWEVEADPSLTEGAEVISPVLHDNSKDWDDFDNVCSIAKTNASIGKNAGSHVHVGAHVLGNNINSWFNFIKLWSIYENIIFRFTNGENLISRPYIDRYAKPVSSKFISIYDELITKKIPLEYLFEHLAETKYQAVNFANVDISNCNNFKEKNTIEFRSPNGTMNSIIWQNNVNLFVRLLEYSKSNIYDDDKIEKRRIEKKDYYNDFNWYNEIYLEQALELVDMIFDKNIDKINFLKQYVKSFIIPSQYERYLNTLVLTKK